VIIYNTPHPDASCKTIGIEHISAYMQVTDKLRMIAIAEYMQGPPARPLKLNLHRWQHPKNLQIVNKLQPFWILSPKNCLQAYANVRATTEN
jgi:hypothetical protein